MREQGFALTHQLLRLPDHRQIPRAREREALL